MKTQVQGATLQISDVKELGASNSNSFLREAHAALTAEQKHIEVDLSQTTFLDSCGLGTLVALYKTVCSRNGSIRLLNPNPAAQQILELTRMHRIFQIVNQ